MKKRIKVKDLETGMFVAELDRPWLESPFLFQGFVVENDDEIGKLQTLCEEVVVDDERSRSEVSVIRTLQDSRTESGGAVPFASRFEMHYSRTTTAHRETRNSVIKLLDDRRLGRLVSTDSIRHSVANLMRTIMDDPTVSLWLTRIRGEDEFSAAHSMNVATLSIAFARHLGMPEQELLAVGLGALLHDIGLSEAAAPLTRRSEPLSPADFDLLRKHPLDGFYSIRDRASLNSVTTDIVRWHHERIDGSGYPEGLKGDQIPRHVLIVAIADMYDAMVSDRPFRKAMPPTQALTEIHRVAERTFGKELVRAFIQCIGLYPTTSVVRLNTGAVGVVMASDESARLQPLLLMLRDEHGRNFEPGKYLDLGSVERKTGQRWHIAGLLDSDSCNVDLTQLSLPSS